jgi:hypothetical protein
MVASTSTAQARLEPIEAIYDDALADESSDLATAQTLSEVAAVQANVANARHAYFLAVEALQTQSEQQVESAYLAARAARYERWLHCWRR